MKLFGNYRGGRVSSGKGAAASGHDSAEAEQKRRSARAEDLDETRAFTQIPEQPAPEVEAEEASGFSLIRFWKGLNGTVRGLIMLLGALLVLALVLVIVYKTFVKPPEQTTGNSSITNSSNVDEDSETFYMPPSTVTVITQIDPDTGEEIQVEVEVPASRKEGYYNILVAGTDNSGSQTDTIIIARLDVTNHSVALLSIPRDTLIDTSYSVPKINGAFAAGGKGESGMAALRTQLARLLGFEVDGYVLVDFRAFQELIELVGDEYNGEKGVWFDVPVRMYYSDPTQNLYIDLYAGYQHLNADECEDVVRFRSGYTNADIGRISVQQDFIRALANQCLKIGNITKIQELAELYIEYVTTDLTVGNIVYFAQELLKCNFDEMQGFTLEGEGVDINGLSYYEIYTNKNLRVINEYFNPYDVDITAANVVIPSASWFVREDTNTTTTTPDDTQVPDGSDGEELDPGQDGETVDGSETDGETGDGAGSGDGEPTGGSESGSDEQTGDSPESGDGAESGDGSQTPDGTEEGAGGDESDPSEQVDSSVGTVSPPDLEGYGG